MSCAFKVLISNWQTRKFSSCFWLFSLCWRVGHTLHPIFLSDWWKFDRWIHVKNFYAASGNLFTDRWSWLSFVSSYDVIKCLFPRDVQNVVKRVPMNQKWHYIFQKKSLLKAFSTLKHSLSTIKMNYSSERLTITR